MLLGSRLPLEPRYGQQQGLCDKSGYQVGAAHQRSSRATASASSLAGISWIFAYSTSGTRGEGSCPPSANSTYAEIHEIPASELLSALTAAGRLGGRVVRVRPGDVRLERSAFV